MGYQEIVVDHLGIMFGHSEVGVPHKVLNCQGAHAGAKRQYGEGTAESMG